LKTFLLTGLLGVIFLLLYWITIQKEPDPCAEQYSDIAAAILADNPEEQDVLVSRAILIRGACESKE